MTLTIPTPSPQSGLRALRAIATERHTLAAMQVFHRETGDVFRLNVPGFSPVVMVGPEAAHFVLVAARGDLRWRIDGEPITNLLIHGVLVEDGQRHDEIRRNLNPSLHKQMLTHYTTAMVRRTDQITATWGAQPLDMLVEMRKVALLVLMDALFDADFTPEVQRLWDAILYLIRYISPGLWLFWKGMPSPGYSKARARLDDYLLRLIALYRAEGGTGHDMIRGLIAAGMPDDLIRDQLMTMLIAGHDTGTAALAWALYLLGQHPHIQQAVRDEIAAVLGSAVPDVTNTTGLTLLDQVIDETLRLYPPIHLGSRTAAVDLNFAGYEIPAGTRVLYSIFLTQRHPAYWQRPDEFMPERFTQRPEPYTYLPFGGGPRNCIGAAFAQVEMRVVLARILQRFQLQARRPHVHMHMGATLEPRPGVWMQPVRNA